MGRWTCLRSADRSVAWGAGSSGSLGSFIDDGKEGEAEAAEVDELADTMEGLRHRREDELVRCSGRLCWVWLF